MSNKKIIWILVAAIVIVLGYIGFEIFNNRRAERLATCLTQKHVIFYGASWCPHCKEQREIFGSAFKDVPYVECSNDESLPAKPECLDKKIDRYPTWIGDDGQKVVGVYKLETLAKKFGCE